MAKIKAFLSLLLAALMVFGGLVSVNGVHASIGIVSTVTVGTYLGGVAYDSGKGEVFVADVNGFVGGLSVISDISNTVVATIPTKEDPYGVAYDSGKGEIFTANVGGVDSVSVSVISDTTNSVVATINISETGQLGYVAYDSGKGEIFVTSINSIQPGTVTVISDETNTIVANITVGIEPVGIVYDSGNSEIYVANSGSDSVSVISDSTNIVVATIPFDKSPGFLAYDPGTDGNGSIYVTTQGSDFSSSSISVISDKTNTVTGTIEGIWTGPGVASLVYDYGVGALFVTNYIHHPDGFSSNSSVLAVVNGTVAASVATPGGWQTFGMAYDFVKGEIFVAFGSNSVLVISDSSGASASPSPTASATPISIATPPLTPSPTTTPTPTPTPSSTPTPTFSPSPTVSPSPSAPEFPTWTTLPLVLVAALATFVFAKRKGKLQNKS